MYANKIIFMVNLVKMLETRLRLLVEYKQKIKQQETGTDFVLQDIDPEFDKQTYLRITIHVQILTENMISNPECIDLLDQFTCHYSRRIRPSKSIFRCSNILEESSGSFSLVCVIYLFFNILKVVFTY